MSTIQITQFATLSRRLLMAGTLTLGLLFALLLAVGFGGMGFTPAVMLILAMFMPASFLFSWAVLLLLRRGRLSVSDWLVGPAAWLLTMAMFGVATATDGQPLLSVTPELRQAELAGAVLYIMMQSYYMVRAALILLAAEVNAEKVKQEAEMNAEEVKQKAAEETNADMQDSEEGVLSDEAMQAISEAVETWTARGGHCKAGLLLPLAAADIGVPKYRLTCWLHQKGLKYTDWIAALRVEEAKRTIKAHPEWQNEAVAEHCGFTERSLLRSFKKLTGMTPAQYAAKTTA